MANDLTKAARSGAKVIRTAVVYIQKRRKKPEPVHNDRFVFKW